MSSIEKLNQPMLGFALPDGEVILRAEGERGHIELAMRIIDSDKNMKGMFEKSDWFPSNPVDFLIFRVGAAKIGNRWGQTRLVQYYPYLMTRKILETLEEYKSKNYDIREVYPPEGQEVYFHR